MRLTADLVNFLSSIRAAIAFLTRIPVGHGELRGEAHTGASAHLPLVGALLGLLGTLVWVVTVRLDSEVRAWLVVVTLLLTTGAFHEDGLADTVDALGGAYYRSKLFEILKDSRIGTFGAAALICTLVLRAKLLSQLLPGSLWPLIAGQTLSRLAPVLLMACLPYVTADGTSRSGNVVHVGPWQVTGAVTWSGLVAVGLFRYCKVSPAQFTVAVIAQSVAVVWLAFRFRRRAGGLTGDFLGATQQVGELAFLLGACFARPSLH